jgi:hypothetical protein
MAFDEPASKMLTGMGEAICGQRRRNGRTVRVVDPLWQVRPRKLLFPKATTCGVEPKLTEARNAVHAESVLGSPGKASGVKAFGLKTTSLTANERMDVAT